MVATTRPEPSTLLVTTTSEGAYPRIAGCYFACKAEDGTVIHALNLGRAIPPVGTRVVATRVGTGERARWVFNR